MVAYKDEEDNESLQDIHKPSLPFCCKSYFLHKRKFSLLLPASLLLHSFSILHKTKELPESAKPLAETSFPSGCAEVYLRASMVNAASMVYLSCECVSKRAAE